MGRQGLAYSAGREHQRGTGGSYFGCDPETLTLEQLISDCAELIAYLCKTLDKKKIFLLGAS